MRNTYSLNLIKWSLRKANLKIGPNALVLDVGSGSNPHPAADVLLEKYVDITHRYDPLVADRPTILADACKTPFKDKAFDFIITFHVLEHIDKPELFLNELQRIGKAGYIETPNAIFERFHPYDVHVLEVMNINNELIINKKISSIPDKFFNELNVTIKNKRWNKLFYSDPDLFHVRYFWKDTIKFKVFNPEVDADWVNHIPVKQSATEEISSEFNATNLRSYGLKLLRNINKLRKNTKVNLSSILVCPECHSKLNENEAEFICEKCKIKFSKNPIPDFTKYLPL